MFIEHPHLASRAHRLSLLLPCYCALLTALRTPVPKRQWPSWPPFTTIELQMLDFNKKKNKFFTLTSGLSCLSGEAGKSMATPTRKSSRVTDPCSSIELRVLRRRSSSVKYLFDWCYKSTESIDPLKGIPVLIGRYVIRVHVSCDQRGPNSGRRSHSRSFKCHFINNNYWVQLSSALPTIPVTRPLRSGNHWSTNVIESINFDVQQMESSSIWLTLLILAKGGV